MISGRNRQAADGTAGEKTAELVVTVTENTSNTKVDQSGTVGQEPEEGVSIAYMHNLMPNMEEYHHLRMRAAAYGSLE